jgi:hypothetical protein
MDEEVVENNRYRILRLREKTKTGRSGEELTCDNCSADINANTVQGQDAHEPDHSWLTRTVKHLWHRAIGKNEKPTRNEDWSIRQGLPRPSLSYYTDVEAQLVDPVGFPLLERCDAPIPVAAGGRPLPGTFPAKAAVKAAIPVAPNVSKAHRAVKFYVPGSSEVVPREPTEEYNLAPAEPTAKAQTPESVEPSNSPSTIENLAAPVELSDTTSAIGDVKASTESSNTVVGDAGIPGARCSSVASLKLLPLTSDEEVTRSLSPDWVPAPTRFRPSKVLPAIEPSSRSSTSIDLHQELLDSISNFRFSHMVSTDALTLDKARKFRAMIEITCNNLFNAGWDLTRLYMIWCDITEDVRSIEKLLTHQPWTRLNQEHVEKACELMLRGVSTYRFWAEQVEYSRAVPVTRVLMGEVFWKSFDAKLLEFDGLRLDGVTEQVEVIMEQCLGMKKKEVATLTAPSGEEGTIPATGTELTPVDQIPEQQSTADILEPPRNHTTPWSEMTGIAIPQKTPAPVNEPQVKSTHTKPLTLGPTAQHPLLIPEQASKSIPSFARPTKSSLKASQLPVENGKPVPKIVTPEFQKLAADIENVRSQHLPQKIQRRVQPQATSNELLPKFKVKSRASPDNPPIKLTIKPRRQLRPTAVISYIKLPSKVPATMRVPLRSDSVHDKKSASTLPRNFSPLEMWATSPPIYSSTTIPLRVNALGSKSMRFARPRLGDAPVFVPKNLSLMPMETKPKEEHGEVVAVDKKRFGVLNKEKPGTADQESNSSGTEVWHDALDVAV